MTNILLTPLIEGSLSRCETISYPCLSMVGRFWCEWHGRFCCHCQTLQRWWQTEIRTRVSECLHGPLIIVFLGCGSESHLVFCLQCILTFQHLFLPGLCSQMHVFGSRYEVMIYFSLIRCLKDAATSKACRSTMRVVWPQLVYLLPLYLGFILFLNYLVSSVQVCCDDKHNSDTSNRRLSEPMRNNKLSLSEHCRSLFIWMA